MDKAKMEILAKFSIDFQSQSEKMRRTNCEIYKTHENRGLAALRFTLDAMISKIYLPFLIPIVNTNDKISYQLDLSASFIRTYFIINDLILAGDIIESVTLLRKQIENLTRLIEIDKKPLHKLNKKTPNVCSILSKMGKSIYLEFSEIAHFGTHRVGELIKIERKEEGISGPSVFPIFTMKLYEVYKRNAFISIPFVYWIIEFLKINYNEKYDSSSDEFLIVEIFTAALSLGIFVESENI